MANENEKRKEKAIVEGLANGDVYYAPFRYAGEEYSYLPRDGEVHCAEEAALPKNPDGTVAAHHADEGKIMRFIKIKDARTGNEYLPLFSSVEKLRAIYPESMARVALVGKRYVERFASEGKGVLLDCETLILNDFIESCGFELAAPPRA